MFSTRELEPCVLCQSFDMDAAYEPEGTLQNRVVFVCNQCSMVQSLPRHNIAKHKPQPSFGAAFGNLRYGKSLRTKANIKAIDQYIEWGKINTVIDIGASRGHFVAQCLEKSDTATVFAIEPDESLPPITGERVSWSNSRIETVFLAPEMADLIYMSHTLEHLHAPLQALYKIRNALAPGGYLFVEVPNLGFINREDVIEEHFLDKHLLFFSEATIRAMLVSAGFQIAYFETDTENISIMAQISISNGPVFLPDSAKEKKQNIEDYQFTRMSNKDFLKRAAFTLNEKMETQKIAFWGAGRILDAFANEGLRVEDSALLIDKYIPLKNIHGKAIASPSELARGKYDLLVVFSREYASEITQEAQTLYFGDIVVWNEL